MRKVPKRQLQVNLYICKYAEWSINILLKKIEESTAQIVDIFIQKHTFQRQLPSFLSPWSQVDIH